MKLKLKNINMNKADKQRLINTVLERNPNCTECDRLINNYQFEYEPKFMPLDAPVVSKRADNGKKWVMCYECSTKQETFRNIKKREEANAMIDKDTIQKAPSIKSMSKDEIKQFLQKQNLAINILLGKFDVPKEIIKQIKATMRSEFHINYYLKNGKFLTEKENG